MRVCVYVTLEAANGISMKVWEIFYTVKILKALSLFESHCVSSETKEMEPVYHTNILSQKEEEDCIFSRVKVIPLEDSLWHFQQRWLTWVLD